MDKEITTIDKGVDLQPPNMYAIIVLNDDYTPMDFVIELLMTIFGMSEKQAFDSMIEVHTQGEAIAGVYSYDVAESRVAHVNAIAQGNEVPLRVEMRPE